MSAVDRMARLFRGLERAHGVSSPTGERDARGKMGAKYHTKRDAPDEETWRRHLAGDHTVVPIPIRDDATTGFAAIDVDVYPLDLGGVAARVEELGLPLVTVRSKSGGAHLFLFLREPFDASAVQERVTAWATALGYPGVEVFPKQVTLASEKDTGNGIAAPYSGGGHSLEYAVDAGGNALGLDAFLDLAESRVTAGDELPEVSLDTPDDLSEAPPCLRQWARVGVGQGQRNDVMFDFALYARQAYGDDEWQGKFEEFNRRYCEQPLPSEEVLAIIKSVQRRKTYTYKAKCEGPYCNPAECRKCEFGRGGGFDDPGATIDGLVIVSTDPKTYILSVDGRRVEMDSTCLLRQEKFRGVVLERLDKMLKPMKTKAWNELCESLLASAEHEEAPEDAGPRGQIMQHMEEFFDEHLSEDRDKLRLGHAWHDVDSGRIYFRSRDFMGYLKRQRVHGITERDLFNAIRAGGGGSSLIRAGKGPVRVWYMPEDSSREPEPLKTPDVSGASGGEDQPF